MTPETDQGPRSQADPRGYVICSAPRAGSTFLCEVLTSTGVLGRPEDYFNGSGRRSSGRPDYPSDPGLQMREILASGSTPNGIYGFKIFPRRADIAAATSWPRALPNLGFVHLERADLLGQALSLFRARRTRQFRSDQPSGRAVRYDRALVESLLREIIVDQARWRLHFARAGIAAVHLVYEDVARDPQSAVDAVATLMGLLEAAVYRSSRIRLEVQRDDQIAEWRERFLSEKSGREIVGQL